MDLKSLEGVVENLESILKILSKNNLEDRTLRYRYAEFLVAREIAKELDKREYKLEVQVLNERDVRSADIYIPEINRKVEVKSGSFWEENGIKVTAASFGKGKQIRDGKFDFCVFVAFDGIKPEFYVFSRDELVEVAENERRELADHPDTNPCLLFLCRNYDDYERYMENSKKLNVEIDLHKNPEKYKDRWSKIFS